MTAPAVTVTYVANTVLTASNLNTNFSDLVTYLSNRNDGSATWDRLLVTSASAVPLIVNNSTGTSNIVNFQDNGTNVFQIVNGGDVYMSALKKLYLDGGNNTYIVESAGDTIDFVSGGSAKFRIGSGATVEVLVSDFGIPATNKLYLDGIANTYITESGADIIDFIVGGVTQFRIQGTGTPSVEVSNANFAIPTTMKLFLDGGGDTYLTESSANIMDLLTGGTTHLRIGTSEVKVLSADFTIPTTNKLYLDGGTNTYIVESAGDQIDFTTGGTLALSITSGQILDYRLAVVALGAGGAATLGLTGGSGPATTTQNSWVKIKVTGTDSYIPIWR